MASSKTVVTLNIADDSDGTGVLPDASKGLTRNDAHYLEKIGERWAKETGRFQNGVMFKVDRLPVGYAGFEKGREGSKHVDRYIWGHPNGVYRSLNEFWPHFTQLQEMGGTVGCECVLCTGKKKKPAASSNNSTASRSPAGRSKYFPATSSKPPRKVATHEWQDGKRRKQVDDEGTPDLYRSLLDQLKAEEDSGETMNVEIRDMLSPDWRAGHELLQDILTEWQAQPSYVPRLGEVVLFARNVNEDGLAWDPAEQVYLRAADSKIAPKWEAGVVTQMPMDPISSEDLTGMPKGKRGVNSSGFRVEPLSQPSSADRPLALTHKYVALHAIRPFCLLKECLAGREQEDWHPSIRHALTVTNSFCVVGRYAFKGAWPEATVFSRGVYIGSELIMLGDVVRILPVDLGHNANSITDVMVVTSIRLRFVNLEEANDDDFDSDRPYNTALHIVGKAYTLDPKRSYSGTAKTPVTLREGLAGYGQFYHMTDPSNDKARLELPFQRILGRCYDDAAAKAWFAGSVDLSAGLAAMQKARIYSSKEDSRIDGAGGKSWFWAETRIEQLDLHEINGRFVGIKDESRSRKQLHAWRQALKALDGKRGALEEYHAARKQREEEEKQESAQAPSSAWGLMAASANVDSATDAEKDAEMDGDQDEEAEESGNEHEEGGEGPEDPMDLDSADGSSAEKQVSGGVVIDLLSDDDDDDDDGGGDSDEKVMKTK